MPTLTKRRGTKRWRGQIWKQGRVVASKWFGTTEKDRRAAILWEEATKAELEEKASQTPMACLTILAWATAVLDDAKRRRSAKTYAEKRDVFKRLLKDEGFHPDAPVVGVGAPEALAYLQSQFDARSGCAANKDRKNLVTAWTWGLQFLPGFPAGPNPFLVVKRFPEVRRPRYVPHEEDFRKVLNVAEGQDRVMLLAFLHLAARRNEVFGMTWADVDFAGSRVRLATKKTRDGSVRYDWLPVTDELRQALVWWWEARPHKTAKHVFIVSGGFNFENQYEGEPFRNRQHFMERLCERAGVTPFGFHAIRHLSAVILFQAGYPVATIKAILRHENAGTTEQYLKRLGLDPEALAEAVAVFERRGPAKIIPIKKEAVGGHPDGLQYPSPISIEAGGEAIRAKPLNFLGVPKGI